MLRAVAASVLMIGMLVLSGCVPSSGPVAFMPPTDAPHHDALLQGTLRITDDCVWVEADDADYIPVFEVGDAGFVDGALVFGAEYHDGDDIQIGGATAAKALDDWYVPEDCPDAELWAAAPPFEA